jgi:hypothetical protein
MEYVGVIKSELEMRDQTEEELEIFKQNLDFALLRAKELSIDLREDMPGAEMEVMEMEEVVQDLKIMIAQK